MFSAQIYRFSTFIVVFLWLAISPNSGNAAAGTVQWPSNSINLSQLQALFSQNPGLSQLNVLFPNQTNWAVTPSMLQTITSVLQNEAQSAGVTGKLPDIALSALGGNSGTIGLPQLSIASLNAANLNPDALKSQMDTLLQQLRYQNFGFLNSLPDWLKNALLTVYDAVYNAMEYLGAKLASLFTK